MQYQHHRQHNVEIGAVVALCPQITVQFTICKFDQLQASTRISSYQLQQLQNCSQVVKCGYISFTMYVLALWAQHWLLHSIVVTERKIDGQTENHRVIYKQKDRHTMQINIT